VDGFWLLVLVGVGGAGGVGVSRCKDHQGDVRRQEGKGRRGEGLNT
jgi:hypothetical protein